MAASRPLRVRDPVHGLISYDEREADLIDTPVFQRLMGIRQLALTSLVYPGATHTRFEHSLGVMHLAGRIAERLRLTDPARLLRLAALLHDIGHLPFSHAGEAAAGALDSRVSVFGEEAHERITSALVEHDPAITKALRREDRLAVLDILEKGKKGRWRKKWEPLLSQIVSGPLDADKLDYLLRDSLMAGVKYGVFDIERMVDSLVAHGQFCNRGLLVRKEDLYCVEQLLLARYYITEQVYRHRVRRVTDAMLRQAVIAASRLPHSAAKEITALFRVRPQDSKWRSRFLSADDGSVLATLAETPPGSTCRKLACRLLSRRLLKQVFAVTLKEIRRAEWTAELVEKPSRQEELALRFAEVLDMDPDLVIVDLRTRENPLYRDPGLSIQEEIRVVDGKGNDQRLADVEGSLAEHAKPKAEDQLCVYAPADGASQTDRDRIARKIAGQLKKAATEATR